MADIKLSDNNSKQKIKKALTKTIEDCNNESWNDFIEYIRENIDSLQSNINNSMYLVKPEALRVIKEHVAFFEKAGAVNKINLCQSSETLEIVFELSDNSFVLDKSGISEFFKLINSGINNFMITSCTGKKTVMFEYSIPNAIAVRGE